MPLHRRDLLLGGLAVTAGCVPTTAGSPVDLIWGRRGWSDGRFLKPRAIAIDAADRLSIVDTTGRIQVFDIDGHHRQTFSTPQTANGRPTGLAHDGAGRLLVADTHYYRVLIAKDGQWLTDQTLGGVSGDAPGQFAFVTDAVTDSAGNVYVGEYGASDRIQRFDPGGNVTAVWGGTGKEPGRFVRPQSLVIDGQTLWVADACNHRIQRFAIDRRVPELIGCFGSLGSGHGQFHYPYDLAIDTDGTVVVCEYGNQRLQRVTAAGQSLGIWGSPGHGPGQLYQPWGVVIDSARRVTVIDSNNHRVQRILGHQV